MRKFLAIANLVFTLVVSSASADPNAPPPPYPFAMVSNGNFLTNGDYPPAVLDAGARMVRLDLCFSMVRAQPGDDPSAWAWQPLEQVKQVRAATPQIEALALLGYCPAWAGEPKWQPKAPEISNIPRGLDVTPVTDPKNLYGHFVYQEVQRYKNVIHDWESWNEPDLPGQAFFKGTGADFFPIQKTCYLAAKAADPACRVLFAGMCYGSVEGYVTTHHLSPLSPNPVPACFLEDYLKECARDPDAKKNHYYFDVLSQHSYSRATDLYDYVAVDCKLLADYLGEDAKTKPVWVTEMGFPDAGGVFGGTPDEYCDYILQSFAWGKLAGVQRFFHFQLDNSNGHGLYDGMLGKPKPALITYRDVLTREFAGVTTVTQLHGRPGVGFLEGNSPYKPAWKSGYDAFEFQTPPGAASAVSSWRSPIPGRT